MRLSHLINLFNFPHHIPMISQKRTHTHTKPGGTTAESSHSRIARRVDGELGNYFIQTPFIPFQTNVPMLSMVKSREDYAKNRGTVKMSIARFNFQASSCFAHDLLYWKVLAFEISHPSKRYNRCLGRHQHCFKLRIIFTGRPNSMSILILKWKFGAKLSSSRKSELNQPKINHKMLAGGKSLRKLAKFADYFPLSIFADLKYRKYPAEFKFVWLVPWKIQRWMSSSGFHRSLFTSVVSWLSIGGLMEWKIEITLNSNNL